MGDVRATVQPLEDRRLMSLTVSLQTTTGATSAVVTAGEVVTLDVIATVTGANGTAANDELEDVEGSFLSTAVGTSAVAGNLAVTSTTSPFNALGSEDGTAQDLNGDGHVDVGSNDTSSSGVGGYFLARADGLQSDGVVSGATMSFQIATVTYTVTALNGGGQTNIAFRPRDTSSQPGTVAAVWMEAANTVTNEKSGTFRAGSPFRVYTSAGQAATTGTVTASVYGDTDGSGTRNGSETGLAAATVYVDLHGTGAYDAGDPSALSSASGVATINNVPAGTYTVRELPPNGYTQSQPASSGGYSVTVTAGQTSAAPGAFGAEPDGSIAGSAYIDANGNGTDDGEAPAAGASVYLDVNGDGIDDAGDVTTTTGNDGTFTLANVAPGTYTLRAVAPAGDAVTQPSARSYTVTVAPGGAVTGETFGFGPAGTVTGTVFTDTNGDGSQDNGEAGLAGVAVYLDLNGDGSDGAGDMTTTTNSSGVYTLADVTPGTYTLRDVVPTGDTQSVPTGGSYRVTLATGTTVTAGPFGVVPPVISPTPTPTATTGSITGMVDLGAGTPLAGATVYLDTSGNGQFDTGEPTAVSAADGTYTFSGLAPGTYTVRPLIALGDVVSEPTAGSYALTVTAGGTDGATDFTLTPLPASPLTAAVVSVPATSVIAGAKGTLKVRITNGGATPFAGSVVFSIYASISGTVSTQDAAIGTATIKLPKIKVGKTTTVAVRYTFPQSLATGSYHLVAAASTGATTAPALATAAEAVAVAAATVDLSPTLLAPLAGVAVKPGKNGSVSVRIANSGNTTAVGPVTTTVYATTTGTADATAVSIGSVPARNVKIGAGKATAVKVTFAAPTSMAAGTYQLIAVISAATTPTDTGSNDASAAVATR